MIPYILLQTIIVPVIAALFILINRRKLGRKSKWIPNIVLLYTTALLFIVGSSIYPSGQISEAYGWGHQVTFGLLADGLSLPIALIISIICLALSFYSHHYVAHRIEVIYGDEDEKTQLSYHTMYYWLFLLFPASFMGICFATNLIVIYLFIELLVIPLYFIMSYIGYEDRFRVAMMCFLWGIVGGTFVLFGSVLVYSQIGSFEISELHTLAGNPMTFWITLLILLGLSTKLAIFPLHIWMRWVHAEHPTCIAGLLAVYANLGAYVIVRVLILPLHDDFKVFGLPLMVMALLTMVYGSLLTLAQDDVKRFCAVSTISQIAYSVLGLGALTVCSIEGGMFYFLSHIMGKTILFSTAGIIVYTTGIRDMRQMGGLASKMPITATLWILGAIILAALPPLSGFAAEWVLFTGIFKYGTQGPTIALVIAIMGISAVILTISYAFVSAKRIFFGPLKPELANNSKIRDPPLTMSVPLLVLATISLILGVYPKLLLDLFHSVIGLL